MSNTVAFILYKTMLQVSIASLDLGWELPMDICMASLWTPSSHCTPNRPIGLQKKRELHRIAPTFAWSHPSDLATADLAGGTSHMSSVQKPCSLMMGGHTAQQYLGEYHNQPVKWQRDFNAVHFMNRFPARNLSPQHARNKIASWLLHGLTCQQLRCFLGYNRIARTCKNKHGGYIVHGLLTTRSLGSASRPHQVVYRWEAHDIRG